MQTVNIASIAALTTLGVTYILDKLKDKNEKNLREEIKERVYESLRENAERLRALEQDVDRQVSAMIS